MGRFKVFCIFAAAFLFLSGCVREESNGAAQSFTYELWAPLSALLGGIVAVPAGWLLRRVSSRLGWGLLILGPIAALVLAPSLFRDRAVVDDSKFTLRTGIWGLTSVHEVKFDDLQRIRIISEEVRGRRGSKRTDYYLLCERKDGTTAKVPVNNQIGEAVAPHFLQRAADRGIPIVDET